MTRKILLIETLVTLPFFALAWFVCAIGFSIKAGYLCAKAPKEAKETVIDAYIKAFKREGAE